MSCFRIPDSICSDINRACAGFWWGDDDEGRKMHWKTWDEMCKPKNAGGMGFRNLKSFNKALLGGLISNPSSLVARVFKGRYFRECDIMDAKIKCGASYVWRSLADSRPLLSKGLFWRVGNGEHIRVFKDKWIVDHPNGCLSRNGMDGRSDTRVQELLSENKSWDDEKVAEMCWPHEIGWVKHSPIGEYTSLDARFWKFDAKEIYSVKGGYLVDVGYFDQDPKRCSMAKNMWNQLVWKMSVPPKVKVVMWRAYQNIVPAEANLRAHHVPIEGICQLCLQDWGTTEHDLLFCGKIKECWKASRFWETLKKGRYVQLLDIGTCIWENLGQDESELWVVMLWKVWSWVCRQKHGLKENGCGVNEEECLMFWQQYQSTKPSFADFDYLGVKLGENKWKNPRPGRYRVDVDAMFNKEKGCFGVGVIVRDSWNNIVVAMAKEISPSSTPLMAELTAVVFGITLCLQYNVTPVEIFTDSLMAARVLADPTEAADLLPDELFDIMTIARQGLLIGVFHMYRDANRAAHLLAKFASISPQPSVWADSFPGWLMDVVTSDI